MIEPAPTHAGWFLFCPVYLADVDSDGPIVWERSRWFALLFWAAGVIQSAAIWVLSRLDHDYEPQWMFWAVTPIERGTGDA